MIQLRATGTLPANYAGKGVYIAFIENTDLLILGDKAVNMIVGTVMDLTNGSIKITVDHNIIVLKDAVATNDGTTIQDALSSIDQGANASVGDGVIVLAATATDDVMVWYDAEVALGEAVQLATLSGVKFTDLENFSSDNFLIA